MIRLLAILHMEIVLPLQWISGNCEHLSKWEFGVADMPDAVDLMEKEFAKVQRNGKKIMDDKFMFGIFNKIEKKVHGIWHVCNAKLPLREVLTVP